MMPFPMTKRGHPSPFLLIIQSIADLEKFVGISSKYDEIGMLLAHAETVISMQCWFVGASWGSCVLGRCVLVPIRRAQSRRSIDP